MAGFTGGRRGRGIHVRAVVADKTSGSHIAVRRINRAVVTGGTMALVALYRGFAGSDAKHLTENITGQKQDKQAYHSQ